MISGKPVTVATSVTARPSPFSALAVPPVDTSSMPRAAKARAKSMRPVLSETERSARRTDGDIQGAQSELRGRDLAQTPQDSMAADRAEIRKAIRGWGLMRA